MVQRRHARAQNSIVHQLQGLRVPQLQANALRPQVLQLQAQLRILQLLIAQRPVVLRGLQFQRTLPGRNLRGCGPKGPCRPEVRGFRLQGGQWLAGLQASLCAPHRRDCADMVQRRQAHAQSSIVHQLQGLRLPVGQRHVPRHLGSRLQLHRVQACAS